MKKVSLAIFLMNVVGCSSSGISGTYGGDECKIADEITFKSDGTVSIKNNGGSGYGDVAFEMLADYKIVENKISITTKEGKNLVLIKNGDVLEMGNQVKCAKL